MEQHQLFALALGLTEPWYVATLEFSAEDKRLEIGIDFRRGGIFACPECAAGGCKAYDTEPREWRHLNFFSIRPFCEREFLGLIVRHVENGR